MTKHGSTAAPGTEAPEQPGVVRPEDEAPPPPEHCLMCERSLLASSGGFVAARFARFLPAGDATEIAQVIEHPAGESQWVAICTACALAPFWTISQRAIAVAEA